MLLMICGFASQTNQLRLAQSAEDGLSVDGVWTALAHLEPEEEVVDDDDEADPAASISELHVILTVPRLSFLVR